MQHHRPTSRGPDGRRHVEQYFHEAGPKRDVIALLDKSRKILWGRSGNRCAFCRRELVIDATLADTESLVGEECHIVSGKPLGPRHDPAFPLEQLDDPGNLILLCRVHHKMVDDQRETYTVELLQKLKANHEKWVSSALAQDQMQSPIRLRRVQGNVSDYLMRMTSGRDVIAIVGSACAFSFDHDDLTSDNEVELVAGFLQEAQDWGELWSSVQAADRVLGTFRMSTWLQQLAGAGLSVFGAREVHQLEGGVHESSPFPVAILRVTRAIDPDNSQTDIIDDGL